MNLDILIDKIKMLSFEKHGNNRSTQKSLIDSGAGKDFIVNIKTKKSTPGAMKIQQLADYFNVSVDYLLGKSEIPNPGNVLTENETGLILKYSALDTEGKEAVDSVLNYAYKKSKGGGKE